ncbi:MAG: hypothetical protein FWF51_07885 [Chitinivibrionia bacterium]|nr:hypothetical protein [Chitinivibrionia bacterium]
MNFDRNKDELMKHISQKKLTQTMDRRSAEAKSRVIEKEKNVAVQPQEVVYEKTNKPPVAIFGAKSLFMTILKDTLQPYCEICEFSELNKATDFLFSNTIPLAFIDMDPPNDWKDGQEFFTSGKTMNPEMRYIVYHKGDKMSETVEFLQKQGATILKKPIDRIELVERVKEFTAKWREKYGEEAEPESDGIVS